MEERNLGVKNPNMKALFKIPDWNLENIISEEWKR